jgi:acetolactate synthase-1/2/3 large subunit
MALPYELVTRAEDFAEALARTLRTRGPGMIEVDVTAIGPTPVPFTPPVEVS